MEIQRGFNLELGPSMACVRQFGSLILGRCTVLFARGFRMWAIALDWDQAVVSAYSYQSAPRWPMATSH
jgi:hypothetical protein